MNRILILLIIGIISINKGFTQSGLQKLGAEICNEISNVDISKKSKVELRTIATNAMNKITPKYSETIRNLKNELRKKHTSSSDNEINKKVQSKLLFHLFDTCEKYLEMNLKFTQTRTYPDKISLKNIGNDFCSFLDKSKTSSYQKLENLIYDNMFTFIIKHEAQVKKDYKNGIDNSDFKDDLIAYLMRNCGMYYKSTMYEISGGTE